MMKNKWLIGAMITANPLIVLVNPTTDSDYDDMMKMAGSGLLGFTSLAG